MTTVTFVHFRSFDNSACVRPLPYPGTSAWAVRAVDLAAFLAAYEDGEPEVLSPPEGVEVVALSYQEADLYTTAYVYGGGTPPAPALVPFDPAAHCVVRTERTAYCWCGCGKPDGTGEHWENPFQVLIVEPERLCPCGCGLPEGEEWRP